MVRAGKYVVPLGMLLALLSCSNRDLPDYYKLGGLRVLALKTSPSEVDPQSGPVNVSVTPLISDLNGAGRTLTYTLEGCLDPGVSLGATPTCAADPNKITQSGTLTLTAPKYTEPVNPLTVAVPSTVFTGKSDIDRYNGVSYLVTYQLSSPSGDTAKSFKRIVATTRTPVNVIPTVSALQKEGTNLTSPPGQESTITPVVNGGAETFTVKLPDGTLDSRTEILTVSWFLSGGKFKYSRTAGANGNIYTPPESTTLPLFFVAVVRDSRGGVDFVTVGP